MSMTDPSAIRSWAKENGFEISDRGRIPADVHELYHEAQAERRRKARRWAERKGLHVAARGRIPDHVMQEFDRTHA